MVTSWKGNNELQSYLISLFLEKIENKVINIPQLIMVVSSKVHVCVAQGAGVWY